MCLQWCHVQCWLINNDLPCTGCPSGDPQRLPAPLACATCTQHVAQAGTRGICMLTREQVPLAGRCCHWNADAQTTSPLVLGTADLAPWLHAPRGVAGVFDDSETAPEVAVDAQQRVTVNLDDLSVPLVYGVPSADWDAALGWVRPPASTPLPTASPQVDAVLDALACVATGGPALVAALDVLLTTVHPDATLLDADAAWHAITTDLLALCRAQHGTDPAIRVALQRIATVRCT